MVIGMERLIGSAIRLKAARIARGATNTRAEWDACTPAVDEAVQHLQEAVLEISVVEWLTHLDD